MFGLCRIGIAEMEGEAAIRKWIGDVRPLPDRIAEMEGEAAIRKRIGDVRPLSGNTSRDGGGRSNLTDRRR